MELFKTWRKDSNFRIKFLIGLVILILFLNYSGEIKKQTKVFTDQSICDEAFTQSSCTAKNCFWLQKAKSNDILVIKGTSILAQTGTGCLLGAAAGGAAGGLPAVVTTPVGCIVGFGMGYSDTAWISSAISYVTGLITSPCYSSIPDTYITSDASNCKSGYAREITIQSYSGIPIFNKQSYICYTPEKGKTCSASMKPIANILDSLWHGASNSIDDCNTRAYIVIGAAALIFLMVI